MEDENGQANPGNGGGAPHCRESGQVCRDVMELSGEMKSITLLLQQWKMDNEKNTREIRQNQEAIKDKFHDLDKSVATLVSQFSDSKSDIEDQEGRLKTVEKTAGDHAHFIGNLKRVAAYGATLILTVIGWFMGAGDWVLDFLRRLVT